MADITFKIAASEDEMRQVYRLRYRVFVEALGEEQRFADSEAKTIREPYDDTGVVVVAKKGTTVVGTVRINCWRDLPSDLIDTSTGIPRYLADAGMRLPDCIDRGVVASSAKICAEEIPDRFPVSGFKQPVSLGRRLMVEQYRIYSSMGIELHFGVGKPELVGFFRSFGYRRYRETIGGTFEESEQPHLLGYLVVFDRGHLSRIGSLFKDYVPRDPLREERVGWLLEALAPLTTEESGY